MKTKNLTLSQLNEAEEMFNQASLEDLVELNKMLSEVIIKEMLEKSSLDNLIKINKLLSETIESEFKRLK